MKNTFIIFLLFIVFITLNFTSLISFYNNFMGNLSYKKEDFKESIYYFEKSNSYKGNFNLGTSLYKQKNYKKALDIFKELLTDEKTELNFYLNYSLGNTFYRIGEKEDNIKNWQKSIDFYREALDIMYNEKVEKNLKFVLEKLNKQKEKEKNKYKNQEQESPKNNISNNNSKDNEKKSDNEKKQDEKINENTTKNISSESNKSDKKDKLTQEQKTELKFYEKMLKKSEKQNGDYFGKVYKQNNSFSEFDEFFNDPFFDNNFMNTNSNLKDW